MLLCLYVADPATFLASYGVLGTLFSSENSKQCEFLLQNSTVPLYRHDFILTETAECY